VPSPAEIRERFERIQTEVGPGVTIVAATKYVSVEDMAALAEAGVEVVGENRAQDLEAKHAVYGDAFRWHFIGHLQSRKVRDIAPQVRLIHSVASDSVLVQLAKHACPGLEVLIEVNVAGEASKSGIAPAGLPAFLDRCPVPVAGLMTMPPAVADPADNRRHFAALRDLAGAHRLRHLSMGTSQDYEVAVEEGATIVRLGSILYRQAP
jgi:pyridoxal phosphate enzyme (YggS family)